MNVDRYEYRIYRSYMYELTSDTQTISISYYIQALVSRLKLKLKLNLGKKQKNTKSNIDLHEKT